MKKTLLGSILTMQKGKKPKNQSFEKKEGFLPYVDIKAFEKGIIGSYADGEKCLPCEEGELVIVCDGSRSGLVGYAKKGYLGSTLAKVKAEGLNNNYLKLFLQSKYQQLNTNMKGTGTPHVNPALLKSFEILLVSPEQQDRIVQKIEELFADLDKGIEELEQAKARLKVYRQAVLKEAFLVQDTWEKQEFGNLLASLRNGYSKKPADEGKYKILRISSVRAMKLNLSDFRYNKEPFCETDLITNNDLLFTRYNGSADFVGVCAGVFNLNDTYAYPDKIIKCTPKINDKYHSKYLQYYMNHGDARKFIQSKIKTTSGQKGIAGGDIKRTIIYIPNTLEEQTKIVHKIEAKLSACEKQEEIINESVQKAENLRQSILKQAFEGRLV